MLKGIRRSENIIDVGAWLTSKGVSYTKDGGEYSFSSSSSLSNEPLYFSSEDTAVSLSGLIESVTASTGRIRLVKSDGTNATQSGIGDQFTKQENVLASGIKITVSTGGTLKVKDLMLNYGQTALPYEPYGDIPKDITRIAMKGKNLWNPVPNASVGYNMDVGTVVSTTPGPLQATIYGNDLLLTASVSWATTAWMLPITNSSMITIRYKTSSANARTTVYIADNEYKVKRRIGNYSGSIDTEIHVTPDVGGGDIYLVISMSLNSATTALINTPIINYGQTALPYEPYGMQPGWEVRDQQGTILWGADKTLTGTDSISFKGYALPLKSYEIEANMEQAATQQYTIEGTSSVTYQSDGTSISLQIVGNEVQKSPNLADPSKTVPGYQDYDGSIHEPSSANEITTDYIPFTDTIYIIVSGSQSGNINWVAYDENKQALYFYGPYFNPNETITVTPQSASCAFIRASWTNGANQPICITNEPQPGYVAYNGTPTPTVPITPEECGERTGNLWNEDYTGISTSLKYVPVYVGNADVTMSTTCQRTSSGASIFLLSGNVSSGAATNTNGVWATSGSYAETSRTASPIDGYVTVAFRIMYDGSVSVTPVDADTMLNTGSTPADYEPYGYKISFSNGNTTYNVYLSEPLRKIGDYGDSVSSDGTVVRNVGKYALTGNESVSRYDADRHVFRVTNESMGMSRLSATPGICSHFERIGSQQDLQDGDFSFGTSYVYFRVDSITYNPDFIAYLQQQYQNGTPVTVWYVINTPITESVTFPTVTPTQGANTLSVSTTLAPSKTLLTATSGVWPKNPIEPEEFGEPTVNLFDYTNTTDIIDDSFIDKSDGSIVSNNQYYISYKIYLTVGQTYTWRFNNDSSSAHNAPTVAFYNSSDTIISTVNHQNVRYFSFTVPSGCSYIRASVYKKENRQSQAMLNVGSEPLPYEPYGKYKIPITNAGTTYNIFLNEPLRKIGTYADTVRSDGVEERKIKKITLTGSETYYTDWRPFSGTYGCLVFATTDSPVGINTQSAYCTHLASESYNSVYNGTVGVATVGGANYSVALRVPDTVAQDSTEFSTWLANQYSAGHPVEVWYVLATTQTESITAPEIATTQGTNTLAIGTTLTPSKTSITGHIKPITT